MLKVARYLREPTITPFSKYFWKNGYIINSGRLDITIAEYLIISESRFSSAIASWSLIMPGAPGFVSESI